MNKLAVFVILLGLGFPVLAAPPAPAGKGIVGDGPEVVQNQADKSPEKSGESQESGAEDAAAGLETKIADLQKELERLRGRIVIVEGENTALSTRLKTLEDDKTAMLNRVKNLEADNTTLLEGMEKLTEKLAGTESAGPKTQTTAKPAIVDSAVRFINHEGRALRINVNGVWHTLKPGENDIWVPYGPVYIYRYTGAEPKLFWEWKPYKSGYLMEFDVGTPAEKK